MTLAAVVFAVSLGVILWVYAGYPVLVWLVARLRPRPVASAAITPNVSFIICAHNEARVIGRKLENTLALDYPADRLEVIVASDGSTDATAATVEAFGRGVRLVELPTRQGKTAAQNQAVAAARGEILVFSDASTLYEPGTLRALVAPYADPAVGSVGGDLRYVREEEGTMERGRHAYWSYERELRRLESRVHSVLGQTGCVYSLRRELYRPLAPDVISDFVEPALVCTRGLRAVVADGALAYEAAESRTVREEIERRARVVLRGLRGLWFLRELLNPLRHPWFACMLVSHRLLRWAVPIWLLALFAASLPLAPHHPVVAAALGGQVALYAASILGLALGTLGPRVKVPGAFVPLYFCVVNLAPLVALVWLLRGETKATWETAR